MEQHSAGLLGADACQGTQVQNNMDFTRRESKTMAIPSPELIVAMAFPNALVTILNIAQHQQDHARYTHPSALNEMRYLRWKLVDSTAMSGSLAESVPSLVEGVIN
jgi:hypothetical protein